MKHSIHPVQVREVSTKIIRGIAVIALFTVLVPSGLWAQRTSATLSGTVADASGAVIPGANLTATSVTTGASYTAASDAGGYYILNNLAPDEYRLQVEKQGFQTYIQSGIVLRVEQPVTVNISLTVGAITQKVNVNAAAIQVNTVSSTISSQVTPEMAVQLPLNGRNVLQLMMVAPDTGPGNGSGYQQSTSNPSSNIYVSASGGRGDSVNFYLDGAQNEDSYTSIANAFPNPDAIKEFSFETNNYSAKYAGRGGGVMNVVTKNGTNQFHGSAYEFVRYFSMNAGNYFTHNQDGLKRNQFGGTVGGPIQKDKTFFFFAAQGTILRSLPTSNTAIVPTAAERNGDWSAISKQLVNPFTSMSLTNNYVDPTTWDPVATNFMKLVPTAAQANGLTYYTSTVQQTEKQYMGRVDRNFGNKFRVYGTYLFDSWNLPNTPTSGNILTYAASTYIKSQFGSLNFSYTFSPRLLTTLSGSLNRRFGVSTPAPGGPSFLDLGAKIPDILAGRGTGKELYLSLSGYFNVVYANAHSATPATTGDIINNWAYVRGGHTLEFGVEYNKAKLVFNGDSISDGGFAFYNAYSGNNMVDFLMGRPSAFYQYDTWAEGQWRPLWGSYATDTWRATRRLTLNLGVRWNPFYPIAGEPGGAAYWSPSNYSQGIHSTAFPNLPPGYLVGGFDSGIPPFGMNPEWGLVDPRIGFAYDLFGNGKASIRGAYGIFQEQLPMNGSGIGPLIDPPYSYRVVDTPPPGPLSDPYRGTTVPFPRPNPPLASSIFPQPLTAYAVTNAGLKAPTIQEWNFTTEYQLPRNILLRLGYEGSESFHLYGSVENNPAIYNPSLTLSQNLGSTQARRILNPYYGGFSLLQSKGTSSYNGLTVSAQRQVAHGLTFIGGYRWSKCMGEGEYVWGDSATYTTPYNPGYDKGQCSYDIGSKFTFSYVYSLPSAKSLGFAGKHVLGGWQSSGILTWQDGTPYGISTGSNNAANGISLDRANIVGNPYLPSRSHSEELLQWFNISAFQPNAGGTYGDTARDFLRGPGFFNLDFSLVKNIPIPVGPAKETQHLEFRGEFFNFFNHPSFSLPTATLTSTIFGQITSTASSPRIVQLALKFIF